MYRSRVSPSVGTRDPFDPLSSPAPATEPEREEEKPGTERKPG
ncbi:hypothetical protein ACOQFV_07765 [Nocardiopsis changdeensis]|nr:MULTISPECIES: hypothetical protein [Nocardiopsis]